MVRHRARPTSADYLSRIFTQFVELHGDRAYGDDPTIISGVGQIAGQTVAIIAQQRDAPPDTDLEVQGESRTAPEGFRKANRTMDFAAKFSLPLITLIDTSGPDLSVSAEERGLGNTIAAAMAKMSGLNVPTISVVIGQAGSGGALALGVADSTLMLENAIFTAVSPEEVAEVIYQDASRAEDVAPSMRLTAHDCLDLGIIDQIVAEPPHGAHSDPDEAARTLGRVIVSELARLQDRPSKKRANERYAKYRSMGVYSSQLKATLAREVNSVQNLIKGGLSRIPSFRRQRGPAESDSASNLSNGDVFYGADD